MTSVVQGRTVTLAVEWRAYAGGPLSPVTGVTVEIKPVAGGASTVPQTSTGVTTPITGLNGYPWVTSAALAAGDYAVIWRGTDAQSDAVTATEVVTVLAAPVAGAYASVVDLTEHLGSTPTNAAQLLIRASRDVDSALFCQVYDVDDADVIAALKEATLEQIAGNLAVSNTTGLGTTAGGFTLGRLSVQPKTGTREGAPRRVGRLWEQAWQVLRDAQLTGQGPWAGSR